MHDAFFGLFISIDVQCFAANESKMKWAYDAARALSLALRTAHVLLLIIFKIFTIQSNHKSHSQTHAHSIKCCKTRERGYRESTRRPYKIRDFFLVLISIWLVLFSLSHIYTFWWDFDLIWFLIWSQYMYQNQCRAKNTLGIRYIDWFAANKFTSIRMKFREQHSREQMKTSIDGPHVRRPLSYTQSRTHTHTLTRTRDNKNKIDYGVCLDMNIGRTFHFSPPCFASFCHYIRCVRFGWV